MAMKKRKMRGGGMGMHNLSMGGGSKNNKRNRSLQGLNALAQTVSVFCSRNHTKYELLLGPIW